MGSLTATICRTYAIPIALTALLVAASAWVDQFVPSLLRNVPTIAGTGRTADAVQALAWIGVLAIVAHLIRIAARVLTDRTATRLEARLLAMGAQSLMNNSLSWHLVNHVGEVNVRLTRSAAAISGLLKIGMMEIIAPLFALTFTFRVCWDTSHTAAFGIVMMAVLIVAVSVMQILSQRGVRVSINRGREVLGGRITDGLNGIEQIKLFGAAKREIEGLRHIADSLGHSEYRHHIAMAGFDIVKAIIERGGSIAIIGMALVNVPAGTTALASAGVLIAVLVCVDRFLEPLRALHRIVDEMSEKLALSKDFFLLIETQSVRSIQQEYFKEQANMLVFESVTYHYPGSTDLILNNASAAIPLGAKVAIVGPTGCGKSTIGKLIAGILRPENGTIKIAGADVIAIERQGHRLVGVLTQDVWLTPNLSVLEIIRQARQDATDEEVLDAANIAGVDHDLLFKDGTPRCVTANGSGFSGGQKQRIGLARVLLQNTRIIILDEPCAAQDPTNRERFFEVVLAALADRTLLVITHDHSRLEFATHLMKLDSGQIVVSPNDACARESCFTLAPTIRQKVQGRLIQGRLRLA